MSSGNYRSCRPVKPPSWLVKGRCLDGSLGPVAFHSSPNRTNTAIGPKRKLP